MSSHVDVASHNHTRYVASANTFDNAPHYTHHNYGYYGQEPMSIVNSLNFDATSNIQHVNYYSSAISSQYVVLSQDMPMNKRIGYDNTIYLANCSQNLAPYANATILNSASYVTHNSSRINENSVGRSSSKSWSTKVIYHNFTTITLRYNLQMHLIIPIIILQVL